MAHSPRRIALEYTAQAIADLDQIWEWNALRYGVEHADGYIRYLRSETAKLGQLPNPGRPVPTREIFRYALIRHRRGGAGHLAVFTFDTKTLRVLRYFHTAQDWERKVTD